MARKKHIPNLKTKITLAQQYTRFKVRLSAWDVKMQRSLFVAVGEFTPQPICETYTVKITYDAIKNPQVRILSPNLAVIPGAKELPHVYPGNKLCLHYPDYHEWTKEMFIVDKIVPWISLWLFYYEMWHATGEWLGGGIHPTKSKKQ